MRSVSAVKRLVWFAITNLIFTASLIDEPAYAWTAADGERITYLLTVRAPPAVRSRPTRSDGLVGILTHAGQAARINACYVCRFHQRPSPQHCVRPPCHLSHKQPGAIVGSPTQLQRGSGARRYPPHTPGPKTRRQVRAAAAPPPLRRPSCAGSSLGPDAERAVNLARWWDRQASGPTSGCGEGWARGAAGHTAPRARAGARLDGRVVREQFRLALCLCLVLCDGRDEVLEKTWWGLDTCESE